MGIHYSGVGETLQLERVTSWKIALARALKVKSIEDQNRNSALGNSRTSQVHSTSPLVHDHKIMITEKQNKPFGHQELLRNLECWKGHTRDRCPEQ